MACAVVHVSRNVIDFADLVLSIVRVAMHSVIEQVARGIVAPATDAIAARVEVEALHAAA